MEWFMDRIDRGSFEVVNPYSQRVSIVPATPDTVHTIVFWSKNFAPFLEKGYGELLTGIGFNLFFNFTINSHLPVLEPNVPSLAERLAQLEYLCNHFTIDSINWRFDPICFFRSGDGSVRDNLDNFQMIAHRAADLGVRRCITSFMDDYPKIRRRTASLQGFSFVDPPLSKRIEILLWMKGILDDGHMELHTCCEKELLDALPPGTDIRNSACVPNDLLVTLFGGHLSLKKDVGQRIKDGCGCKTSVDIGSYRHHPCFHNCLFCYANPASMSNRRTHAEK